MRRFPIPVAALAAAAALAATVALAACGGTPAASSASAVRSADPPVGLEGRTFLSAASTGRVLVAGSQVRITFQGGSVSISAGCNSMSSPYQVVDGRLQTDQMAMTEMACAEPLMAQDQWIAAFVSGAGIRLDGDTLTLGKDGETLTLVDRVVADPDRALLGIRWVVDGIVSGGSVGSVPQGVTAALTFSDGRVDVEAGCNRGTGSVEIGPDAITFGPIGLTKMACVGTVMLVEDAVMAALSGEVSYDIEADTLMLEAGSQGLVLRAAR